MIYILSGNDTKNKNVYLRKLYKKDSTFFSYRSGVKKEEIIEQSGNVSLFGDYPVVVLESVIKEGNLDFKEEELLKMKDSKTLFVFLEDKLLASDLKKYKKFATIEDFSVVVKKSEEKMNVFSIADSFSRRDKMGAWILYREAVSEGVSPEEVSGIIFWKVKNMILNGTKLFSQNELKTMSSQIVSIYHMAHKGESDFTVSLEQFILNSLSKK